MKKIVFIVLNLVLMLGVVACRNNSNNIVTASFKAKIIESNDDTVIVEPLENEEIRRSADKISIGIGKIKEFIFVPEVLPEGTLVEIVYDGNINETYPAQINVLGFKTMMEETEIPTIVSSEDTIIIPNGMNEKALQHKVRIGKFVENTKRDIDDEIKIIQYTIEGDPITKDVRYTSSDGTFEITTDTTEDKFGVPEVTTKTYDETYQARLEKFENDDTSRLIFHLINGTDNVDICVFVCQPDELQEKTLPVGHIETGEFSYIALWNDIPKDSPVVKMDGFVNTQEIELVDVTERAKAEVNIDYNLTQKFYDQETDMWMVHFWSSTRAGGDETVYLNGKGVTQLIMYGE